MEGWRFLSRVRLASWDSQHPWDCLQRSLGFPFSTMTMRGASFDIKIEKNGCCFVVTGETYRCGYYATVVRGFPVCLPWPFNAFCTEIRIKYAHPSIVAMYLQRLSCGATACAPLSPEVREAPQPLMSCLNTFHLHLKIVGLRYRKASKVCKCSTRRSAWRFSESIWIVILPFLEFALEA